MRSRREIVTSAAIGAAALLANALPFSARAAARKKPEANTKARGAKNAAEEVSANDDLMREHGVLRRALLVYALTSPRLRRDPGSVSPGALHRTAVLFRRFGEDYHERRLEEPFIFPAVKKLNPELAKYVEILLAQHQRGREITDYIISQTSGQKLATDASALSAALDSFVLMYQEHTAREDTIIFPAWRKLLSPQAYEEMGDKFEGIEHQQFGHDGFEDAVSRIGGIEAELGLADLAQFTAPPPPKP